MKRIIFIITLVVMFSGGAFAQSETVYTLHDLLGYNTIVRQWGNDKYLLYTEESNGNEKIILIDNISQTHLVAQAPLKQWYKIKDFTVRGDSVFFIGVYNHRGFWGFFNIHNVFTGGDIITYFLTNTFSTSFGGPHGDDWGFSFVDFDELQQLPGNGCTELLITGFQKYERYEGGIMTQLSYTPCLFHVAPPYTNFNYAFNNSGSEKFDDIALIGNYIVVSGRENYTVSDSARILFRIFDAAPFSFTTGLSWAQTHQDYARSMSKVLIEPTSNLTGYEFATAHYGNRTPNQGLYVEYYAFHPEDNDHHLKRYYYTFVNQGNPIATGCTIKKIAYNDPTHTLCVLQDMMIPSLNVLYSAICKFNLNGFPFIQSALSYRTDNGININSIANGINANILYSGRRTSEPLLMQENVAYPANCMDHSYLANTTTFSSIALPHTDNPLSSASFTATSIQFNSVPDTIKCSVLCPQ